MILPALFFLFLPVKDEDFTPKASMEMYMAGDERTIVSLHYGERSIVKIFDQHSIAELETVCKKIKRTNDTSYAIIIYLTSGALYKDFINIIDILNVNDIQYSFRAGKIYGVHFLSSRDVIVSPMEFRESLYESIINRYGDLFTGEKKIFTSFIIIFAWIILFVVSLKERWQFNRSIRGHTS